MNVREYLKFASHVAATVLGAVIVAVSSGPITSVGWTNIVISSLGAIAVLGAGELPSGVWSYGKVIISGLTAAAMLLATFIAAGAPTLIEWLQIAAAFLGAIVVGFAPGPMVISLTPSHDDNDDTHTLN